MPAYLEKEGFFGTKIVSVFPRNIEKKLSTIQAAYLLNDPTTGELLALMDGILLTAMRTGATSALATKYLSRKNSDTLGIIGAGAQAPFQAEAISKVRPIHRMLVYDKDRKIAEHFSGTVSNSLQIPVHVMARPGMWSLTRISWSL